MHRIVSIGVLLLCLGVGTTAPGAGGTDVQLEPGMVNPGYHEKPDWFKNSFLDIREDIEEAAGEGRPGPGRHAV